MRSHVTILAVITIIHASLLLTFGITGLLFFGGLAAFADRELVPIGMTVPILSAGVGAVMAVVTAMAVPKLVAGIGLLYFKNWARVLGIAVCALGLWEIPVGTALGVYGLWVLTNRDAAALFRSNSV